MEKLNPSKNWLEKYEEVKELLVSPVNYTEVLKLKEIEGKNIYILDMGEVNFPSGEILACDPLTYLRKDIKPYLQSVPIGKYKIETLVIEIEKDHYRYLFSRVKFSEEKPVIYRQALNGSENLSDIESDSYFGFPVDAGLATIIDVKTRDAYCDFRDKWDKENPDKNIYDGFFAEIFRKNAIENPKYQRKEGDWINFKIPNTYLNIHMIQSGFGDGVYPVYFGYDKNNKLCDLVMEYILIPS